eukprot:977155-Pyramimonas_sp.AAC.1
MSREDLETIVAMQTGLGYPRLWCPEASHPPPSRHRSFSPSALLAIISCLLFLQTVFLLMLLMLLPWPLLAVVHSPPLMPPLASCPVCWRPKGGREGGPRRRRDPFGGPLRGLPRGRGGVQAPGGRR